VADKGGSQRPGFGGLAHAERNLRITWLHNIFNNKNGHNNRLQMKSIKANISNNFPKQQYLAYSYARSEGRDASPYLQAEPPRNVPQTVGQSPPKKNPWSP